MLIKEYPAASRLAPSFDFLTNTGNAAAHGQAIPDNVLKDALRLAWHFSDKSVTSLARARNEEHPHPVRLCSQRINSAVNASRLACFSASNCFFSVARFCARVSAFGFSSLPRSGPYLSGEVLGSPTNLCQCSSMMVIFAATALATVAADT